MKLILLFIHVLTAVILASLFWIFPRKFRDYLVRWWARRLLYIFKIRVVLENPPRTSLDQQNYLVAANHISWLDIHILNSIKPLTFVAKSEVGSWPVFGYLARQIGTLFIVRERVSDIKRVIKEMQAQFVHRSICIFPEGTSSDGRSILPLKSNLFQGAIDANRPVLPVLIQFRQQGRYSDVPIFVGDMGLLSSIRRISSHDNLEAHIYLIQPINNESNRRQLCVAVENSLLKQMACLRDNENM
jgi:1-acyl-sn-glycerol-3-phosphate acyltransferase